MNTITEGTYSADFVYNADDTRAKMTVKNNNVAFLTRTYIGSSYIKESLNGVEKDYTFVGGDAYSAPVVIEKSGTTKTPFFLLRDYLGNITHTANDNGSLKVECSFDAWCRQRNPSDWTNYAVDSEPDLYMGRGFTGHEHLPWFNLINMNGRLYYPVVGRMLSPDPIVQMSDYRQSFNRYSYCLNNPLANTDPTGYSMVGDFFRWAGNTFDNLGDWMTQNNIQFRAGYSTTTDNFLGGNAYVGTPSNGAANASVAYNISSGKFGLGNDLGGFTNFWYRKQNNTSTEQIVDKAIAGGRARIQSGGGSSDFDNWSTNFGTMSTLYANWLVGDNQNFTFNNDPTANAFRNASGLIKARNDYYENGISNAHVEFGLKGLFCEAGFDPIEQFVGSYDYSLNVVGDNLQFTITNQTTFASAALHLWPYKRNWVHGPMGTMSQTYIFTEPLRIKK